ncbi:MAG: tripartite tricarboxylate transporter substrate binding protein [Betaproteobacteria bacterium]
MPERSLPISVRRRRIIAALAAFAAAGSARPQSGSLPAALTLIVPAPPGSSSDTLGRRVAEALSTIIEVPIRVENIAGNGGVTGTNAMAAAPRDGSVLGLAVSSPIIGGKLLSRSAMFNPSEDFDWLGILGTFPNAMVLSTRSNHTTLEQWLAAARRASTRLPFGTLGTGTAGHLAGAYLRFEQSANLVHVALDSLDEGYALLSDGRLDVLFDGVPNALVKMPRTGHRILAVTSASRLPTLPDVPSFGELWRQSFVVWIGLVTPKGVPPATYSLIASAVAVLFAEPRHADTMRAAGLTYLGLSGRGTRAFVEEEFLRSARLIAKLNDEGQRQ